MEVAAAGRNVWSIQPGALDVPTRLHWMRPPIFVLSRTTVSNLLPGGSLCSLRCGNHGERYGEKRGGAVTSLCASASFNEAIDDAVIYDNEVIAAAWEILDNFNKNDIRGTHQPSLATPDGVNALAASVLAASQAASSTDGSQPLLGVCANDAQEAITALRQWTQALSCEMVLPRMVDGENGQTVDVLLGPVYVKYNAKTKLCYVTPYQGSFRGVIVQIGQRQVGHLPLFLFQGRNKSQGCDCSRG